MTSIAAGPDLRPAKAYLLPDALRAELAQPFGPIVQDDGLRAALAGAPMVLLVGDVVSLACKRMGLRPKVFLVDYHTQRKTDQAEWRVELGAWGRVGLSARNPAGSITREAWDAVRRAIWLPESPVRVAVDGEEDLLGIPCFLEAPDGAMVVYGMPGQGAVVVTVDDEVRRKAAAIVARLQPA
ncbi:MAG: GTP-dependent dephospho-CoA kinase family protein [Thermoplasmatota archaeon]|nr:DUF359 domain-containing protein [Halobacteriales archaeon]